MPMHYDNPGGWRVGGNVYDGHRYLTLTDSGVIILWNSNPSSVLEPLHTTNLPQLLTSPVGEVTPL